jgi:ribose-phosphate pyrophosphokinase
VVIQERAHALPPVTDDVGAKVHEPGARALSHGHTQERAARGEFRLSGSGHGAATISPHGGPDERWGMLQPDAIVCWRLQVWLRGGGGSMYTDLAIFSGRAHPALAQAIAARMGQPLGRVDVFEFSNENIFVQYQENVRQHDVFIVQSFSSPVNTSIMELLIMIDAAKRASAGRITAVIPYYAYGRSDKKDQPRVPISARLLANLLETAGADRVLTMDLHAGQIQGFFNVPVDELHALYPVSAYFKNQRLENYIVVATDVGGEKRARDLAIRLDLPLAIIDKRRVGNNEQAEAMHVIGDVKGKNCLILDDEILTGGTIVSAVNALRQHGAMEIIISCYHPIFSGAAIEKMRALDAREIVITDSVPLPDHKKIENMTVIPVAPQFGDAIARIHSGQSVGALFQ